MGRQAHLTRLALGRSPYAEPLRDADGNFVLGPYAHINDDKDYKQQFDDRGHPRNPSSKSAARQLRRAQNDVLAAVGVVVRKDEAAKSEWEKMKLPDKQQLIVIENQSGRELKTVDRITAIVASWFVTSFRRRAMTYTSYRELPLSVSLWLDHHRTGAQKLLTAGLPVFLISSFPQMYRYYLRTPDVEEIVNFANPTGYPEFVSFHWRFLTGCIHSIAFCLEMPLQAFSSLQSLHLVAPGAWMPLSFLAPFSKASPIWLPALPHQHSYIGVASYLVSVIQTPFVLYIIQDYLKIHIGYRLYSFLRQIMLSPDRPDRISARVSDEVEIIEDTSIPGVGYPRMIDDLTRLGRNYGPKSIWGAFRKAFPIVYTILNFMSGGRISTSSGRLNPSLNSQLIKQVQFAYRSRHRLCGLIPTSGSIADVALQREITYTTFAGINLDPDEELVDSFAWTDAALSELDEVLSTREVDEFDFDEFLRAADTEDSLEARELSQSMNLTTLPEGGSSDIPQSVADGDNFDNNSATLIRPAGTLTGFDQVADSGSGHVDMITDELPSTSLHTDIESPGFSEHVASEQVTDFPLSNDVENAATVVSPTNDTNERPPTPVPGISRATSLTASLPVRNRRLTEAHDSVFSFSDTTGYPHPALRVAPATRQEHRMTLLSTFAVDSFAWHTSALITTLILVPIESMYLRSLANWVLAADQSSALGSLLVASPIMSTVSGVMRGSLRVLGMNGWFGGPASASVGSGRMAYAGTIALSIGLEGLIRGSLWYLGTRRALHRGASFGWGKF